MSQEVSSSGVAPRHSTGCGCANEQVHPAATPMATPEVTAAPQERSIVHIEQMDCPTEEALIRKRLAKLPAVGDLAFNLLDRKLSVTHLPGALPSVLAALTDIGMPGRAEQGASATASSVIFIDKMDCPTEEALIRKRFASLPSVTGLSFDLLSRKLTLEHEPDALDGALRALNEIGLAGQLQEDAATALVPAPQKKTWASTHWKLLLGGVFAAAAEVTALSLGDRAVAPALFSLTAIALTGIGTYRKGWYALRQLTLNINALMAIAVTGAVLIGQWPEAAMVMFLFGIAEAIEAMSLQRAKRAVESLMAMAPETATVLVGAEWKPLPATAVELGAAVRVRPGERIAVDGLVTAGSTSVDQASITGESVPVEKAVGDSLYAGTINQDGEVVFRATSTATNSTLARIVRAVQEAQATQAPTQRFVDKFSAWYTPTVFAIALAVAVIPPLVFGAPWLAWVYRALVMLVVACPCALVISTPVTVVSALTAAARRGILIKGGLFLEIGSKLKVLALDKTGTLTHGKPVVTDFVALEGDLTTLKATAVALSSRSDHPVSRAIAAYGEDLPDLPDVDGFTAVRGKGVSGSIDGKRFAMGNYRLVAEVGASSAHLQERLTALEGDGKTAIVLVEGKQAVAIIAIADTVREESKEAVAQLKRLGVKPVMLTGDNRYTARAIAAHVGIDDARSELLPEDKLSAIKELQSGNTFVGMVGDGANDAPALAKADVGFAMAAAGTDTAIETADVALMDDDPRKLLSFIRLSRSTKTVLWQNIVLAIAIKAAFLGLTIAGQATLWMAVFADMGTSLLVVFNGMRLLRKRF
jgi:Zn2+/Cd2+-exporting ATPase